jgi:uncharacterized protein (TIGR02266 family)
MGDAARNLDPEMRPDARRAARACVYVSIDIFSDHNFWTGLTMNMSEGGVFVATHHAVPVGTTLVLNMTLPFERDPIVTLAEVRWTRLFSDSDDCPPGLGLQFHALDPSSLAKIRKFVTTVREPLLFEV